MASLLLGAGFTRASLILLPAIVQKIGLGSSLTIALCGALMPAAANRSEILPSDPCILHGVAASEALFDMRPAHFALLLLGTLIALFALTFADAARLRTDRAEGSNTAAQLVERLGLSDPVLFTEARYTRHPSQADLQSAFQDHPLAFEHFPSGSLMPPPAGLLSAYDHLDRKTKTPD